MVIDETAVVATDDDGVPLTLVWRGARYRVSDQPTVWTRTSAWWGPLAGYALVYGRPPVSIGGWRFQATETDSGGSLVFDVIASTDEQWNVVCIYD